MPQLSTHSRTLGAAASLLFLLIAITGCGKKTVGPGTSGVVPFQYLAPSSPQNVLQNLVSAYVRRDSVETDSVYNQLYSGISTTLSPPTSLPPFSKTDEVRHVAALRLNPNIVSVSLDLGAPATWQRLPGYVSDPPASALIVISSSMIRIEDAGSATTWQVQNQVMEYIFLPTVPVAGDTTWTVYRWREYGN